LENSKISGEPKQQLVDGGYRFVGENEHSAIRVCMWTKRSLLDENICYKQKFYGEIHGNESHRCLQLSPSLPFCDNKCVFCWRNAKLNNPEWDGPVDDPSEILDEAIEAQRELLTGFKGNPEVNLDKWEEAQDPTMAAISLDGEPTIYPDLDGLIEECFTRDIAPFLVTNGLHPEKLERIGDPAQLYVSLVSPDEETYEKTCNPQISDAWEKLNETLGMIDSFDCVTVLRLTLVENVNMKSPEKYSKLIDEANPDFVEPKGYVSVGHSRERLGVDFMPSHPKIVDFSEKIEQNSNYSIVDEFEPSRVTLLSKR